MADPRITDEAVMAAAKAVSLDWQNFVPGMRAALEAALPLLAPQPVVDREALLEVLINLHASRKGGEVLERDMQDTREEVDAVLALINGASHGTD